MSSLLMAICINGMTDEEIFALTKIFVDSGDVLDFSNKSIASGRACSLVSLARRNSQSLSIVSLHTRYPRGSRYAVYNRR